MGEALNWISGTAELEYCGYSIELDARSCMSPDLPLVAPAQRTQRGGFRLDLIFCAQLLIEFPAFLVISMLGVPLLFVAGGATLLSPFTDDIATLDVLPCALYGLLLCSGPWLAMRAYSQDSRKKSREAMVWSLVTATVSFASGCYFYNSEPLFLNPGPWLLLVAGACTCLGLSSGIHALRRTYADGGHPGAASVKEPVEWHANLS